MDNWLTKVSRNNGKNVGKTLLNFSFVQELVVKLGSTKIKNIIPQTAAKLIFYVCLRATFL